MLRNAHFGLPNIHFLISFTCFPSLSCSKKKKKKKIKHFTVCHLVAAV